MKKPNFSASISSQLKLFLSIISIFLMAGCNPLTQTTDLEKIQSTGSITMGTINGSLTYSYDGETYSGLDYELGKKFAEYLQVELVVEEFDNLALLFTALENNEIDFAGSGLTLTPQRMEKYRSSPPYYTLTQKLVYHKGTYRPRKIEDVNAPVTVLKGSSHEENIHCFIKRISRSSDRRIR